jgi:CBS domain
MTTIEGGLSGMMVLDNVSSSSRRVVGLLTSRDLLRIMALGIRDGESNEAVLNRVVGDYMTPISQVIYGRPEETVGMCRTIMAKLGIKCLPILSREGRVEGLITARDMSDFGLTAKDKGGKQSYLNDVSQRVGLSSNTSMAEPPQYLRAHLALEQSPLFVNVGRAAIPHPFKTAQGTSGRSQRGTCCCCVCVSNVGSVAMLEALVMITICCGLETAFCSILCVWALHSYCITSAFHRHWSKRVRVGPEVVGRCALCDTRPIAR